MPCAIASLARSTVSSCPTFAASDPPATDRRAFRAPASRRLSGKDVLDLLDALGIKRATLAGYDWGGRAACIAAALWPARVRALVSVGGYDIQDIAKSAATPESADQEHQYWYQWYFHTERGRIGLERNRDEIAKLLWRMWSPTWSFSESEFARTAQSFQNPDFVATVIQSYRHRYGNAAGDPALEEFEKCLARKPPIGVPTIALHGERDGVNPPSVSENQEGLFTKHFERRLLPNIGHCPPAEAPAEFSRAIEDALAAS